MANPTITVNVGSINISSSAFAELLRVQLDAAGIPINTTATINLVINIGAGVQTIAPGAFASASALPVNISTSNNTLFHWCKCICQFASSNTDTSCHNHPATKCVDQSHALDHSERKCIDYPVGHQFIEFD